MAAANDYLDALNSYQDQITAFRSKLDQVRSFDRETAESGQVVSLVADPLGAHLLATYGADAIGNLRGSLANVTQGIRQTLTSEFQSNSGLSSVAESLGIDSVPSDGLGALGRFMNQFRPPSGPDPTFGDVELTDFVSGDAPAEVTASGLSDFISSARAALNSRLGGLADLVSSGPGNIDLTSVVRSTLGSGLSMPDSNAIQDVLQSTAERVGIDTSSVARSYADPMLESVRQSFMDIPEISLDSVATPVTDAVAGLTAGGEQALPKVAALAEEGLGGIVSGVGDALETAGEAVAAAGSEAILPAIGGAIITGFGILVSELDKNKEKLPTLPNVAAPQFIPGLS